ncbi:MULTISPECIES: hypothetical protein [Acidiphilium]|uniref:hypothetical protein n=1 Tax=Acidiphilium TaxID=522 RepID=UPI002579944C|nr:MULTISPECIES: hypothetical protein [Acidiphilium]HQT83748.1 hypothetical protein [Acidiphilium rubrum]
MREGSTSFLKKRSKKLSLIWAMGIFTGTVLDQETFFAYFLFTKKKALHDVAFIAARQGPLASKTTVAHSNPNYSCMPRS